MPPGKRKLSCESTAGSIAPAAKRAKSSFDSIFRVLVGPEEVLFHLHGQNLRHATPFFAAACSRGWKEGSEKVIRLPTVEADSFEIYANWIYEGTIGLDLVPLAPSDRQATPLEIPSDILGQQERDSRADDIQQLIKLYVAADLFLDDSLKDEILSEMCCWADAWSSDDLLTSIYPRHVRYVWARTAPKSPLRQLLLDWFLASTEGLKMGAADDKAWPHEFLHDVVQYTLTYCRHSLCKGLPTEGKRCKYHNHEEGPNADRLRRECNAWRGSYIHQPVREEW
ncbi:hypothetical protein LTR53_016378 [Teratosphaeriaceae sp. CCFEE 6253]|nr:hypothetical protein LTR53_016378 [Teratosphaeriaceae sp. CCFEE 6253]